MDDTQKVMERAVTLHAAIAADLEPSGGVLRCTACQTERPLGEVAGHLRHGWPKCCGYTMTWVTQRQLDDGSA
jgi:hypothetical protein